jgi:hypothetical protein
LEELVCGEGRRGGVVGCEDERGGRKRERERVRVRG